MATKKLTTVGRYMLLRLLAIGGRRLSLYGIHGKGNVPLATPKEIAQVREGDGGS